MRLTRRGVIAQRKGGFIWAVYTLVMGVDESTGGTSGSVSLSSSRYKQVAKSYTVSSSGTVSLVNSARTTAANMAVGDYLINVSTSNNTNTTGTKLYKITAISGTSTRKITYTAYTPSLCAKGTDTGERVKSSDGTAYPHYGAQGDYFYVLLRGITTAHVWDVYNVKTTYGYKEKDSSNITALLKRSIATNTAPYAGSAYTFNSQTGIFTIENASLTTKPSSLKSKWWTAVTFGDVDDPNTTKTATHSFVVYGYSTHDWAGLGTSGYITATRIFIRETDTNNPIYSRGTSTGTGVQSVDKNAYPQDGKQDSYWYVYTGTEEVYIDNT